MIALEALGDYLAPNELARVRDSMAPFGDPQAAAIREVLDGMIAQHPDRHEAPTVYEGREAVFVRERSL